MLITVTLGPLRGCTSVRQRHAQTWWSFCLQILHRVGGQRTGEEAQASLFKGLQGETRCIQSSKMSQQSCDDKYRTNEPFQESKEAYFVALFRKAKATIDGTETIDSTAADSHNQ
jgi:hypothetical protein